MTHVRRVAAIACALAALAPAPRAVAQPPPTRAVEARVLEVQGQELLLDLGAASGAAVGGRVELWRPITIAHPVTGRRMTERFLIGELELVQVRPTMALARPLATARAPERGDVVVIHVAAAAPVLPEAPPVAPQPIAPSPSSPSAPSSRPPSPAAPDVAPRPADASEVPSAAAAPTSAPPRRASERAARRGAPDAWTAPRAVTTVVLEEARQGAPLRIALELADARGAVLHVRATKDASYVSIPMRAAGDGIWAADVPGDRIEAPRLEWFVEAVGLHGAGVSVLGDAERPQRTPVRAAPGAPPPSTAVAEAAIWTDYADYNRLRGDDWAWQTEGELGLRLQDEGLRAVRSGFGVYRGQGGSVEELDVQGLPPRDVGLTYGWLEGELAPTTMFAILPRIVVGLGDDGVAGGAQLLFRIGGDRDTNLQLGGEALGTVGVRGIAQLELATFERFPILFRTEVTNQPAGADASAGDIGDPRALGGADVGARGIAQLGFRIVDDLVVHARGSFQGRTIEHAGPGFGGGVSTSW